MSVPNARAFVQSQLEEWDAPGLVWAATTIVSELTTNAVLHARTEFSVELELAGGRLQLRVRDSSATIPVRRHYDEDAATGRGIALIEALTTDWGVTPTDAGKVIWCFVTPETGDGSRVTHVTEIGQTRQGGEPTPEDLLAAFDDADGFGDISALTAAAA